MIVKHTAVAIYFICIVGSAKKIQFLCENEEYMELKYVPNWNFDKKPSI
jgi:hypothetical protein